MLTRISAALNIEQQKLLNKGVYDTVLDFDSPLHIDPALIGVAGIKEFTDARNKVVTYFSDILRLLKQSKNDKDVFFQTAFKKLRAGEGLNTGLGYSRGRAGSGIGPSTARNILSTIRDIQAAGNSDPYIFELVGVFESNVGPDRISDLISVILADEICAYTSRVCSELGIKTKKFKILGKEYVLPINPSNNDYLVFVPVKILSDLPIAENWDDIEFAQEYNDEVRAKLNSLIGESWREAAKMKKENLKSIFIENADVVKEVLNLYKKRRRISYDFGVDHLGDMIWDAIGYKIAELHTLDLSNFTKLTVDQVFSLAIKICEQFKLLVENNGLSEPLWDGNKNKRPERFPQLLLYAVADSYCRANDIDLSREPNAGSGALDFKFSQGAVAKVTCEVKYSSNKNLVEGFEKQLTTYNQAERVSHDDSIYMIIKVNDKNSHKIASILLEVEKRKLAKIPCPYVIVVNAVLQPTASKRR